MTDHTTTLPTLSDTSRRRLSTVAPLADIPEEAAGGDRHSQPNRE
jgi:hypothetical protein